MIAAAFLAMSLYLVAAVVVDGLVDATRHAAGIGRQWGE